MLMIMTNREGDGVRLTMRGELTHPEADRLVREALGVAASDLEAGELIIDLRGVTDCDTSGVAALVRIARGCDLVGWRVILSPVGPTVAAVLKRNGFSGWLEGASGPRERLDSGPDADESTMDDHAGSTSRR